MTTPTPQPAFPTAKVALWLTLVSLAAGGLLAWLAPALFGRPAKAAEAVGLMAAVVWLSAMLSLVPLALSARRGPLAAIKAFFQGMGVRVILVLAALVAVIKGLQWPAGPAAVGMMLVYLPVLFVETRLVIGFIKSTPAAPPGAPGVGPAVPANERGATPDVLKNDMTHADSSRPAQPALPRDASFSASAATRKEALA